MDLELGSYLLFHDDGRGAGLMPMIGVRWNFHLHPRAALFLSPKVGYHYDFDHQSGLAGDFSLGGYWRATPETYLRLEVGVQGWIRIGVAFPV